MSLENDVFERGNASGPKSGKGYGGGRRRRRRITCPEKWYGVTIRNDVSGNGVFEVEFPKMPRIFEDFGHNDEESYPKVVRAITTPGIANILSRILDEEEGEIRGVDVFGIFVKGEGGENLFVICRWHNPNR